MPFHDMLASADRPPKPSSISRKKTSNGKGKASASGVSNLQKRQKESIASGSYQLDRPGKRVKKSISASRTPMADNSDEDSSAIIDYEILSNTEHSSSDEETDFKRRKPIKDRNRTTDGNIQRLDKSTIVNNAQAAANPETSMGRNDQSFNGVPVSSHFKDQQEQISIRKDILNLSSDIKKSNENLLKEISMLSKEIILQQKEYITMKRELSNEIRDMRDAMVDRSKKINKSPANRKKGFAEEIKTKYPLLEDQVQTRVTKEIISRAAMRTLCDYITRITEPTRQGSKDRPSLVGRCVSVLLFGFRPEMLKEVFLSGTGKQYAIYRFLMVSRTIDIIRNSQDLLHNTPNCTESARKEETKSQHYLDSPDSLNVTVRKGSGIDLFRDSFLNRGVLSYTKDSFDLSKRSLEGRKTNLEFRKGVFVATILYEIIIEALRKGRDDARCKFFEKIGFLVHKWYLPEVVGTRERRPMLRFRSRTPNYNPEEINYTTVTVDEHRILENRRILAQSYQSTSDLIIDADYEIKLQSKKYRKNNRTDAELLRNQSHAERKEIRRMIHPMEVALEWCLSICGEGNSKEAKDSFLACHESSTRVVYRIAYVFHSIILKRFLEQSQKCTEEEESTDQLGRNVSLKDLICGLDSQNKILRTKILCITPEIYAQYHKSVANNIDDDEEVSGNNEKDNATSEDLLQIVVDEMHEMDSDTDK